MASSAATTGVNDLADAPYAFLTFECGDTTTVAAGTSSGVTSAATSAPTSTAAAVPGSPVPANNVTVPLTRHQFVIGRNATAHAVIGNPCISGVHCVMTRQVLGAAPADGDSGCPTPAPTGFTVTMADTSSNGCYVNGQRLGKGRTRVLRDGDRVALVVASRPEHEVYNVAAVFRYAARGSLDQLTTDRPAAAPEASPVCPTPEAPPAPPATCVVLPDDEDVGGASLQKGARTKDIEEYYCIHYDQCLGSGSFASVYKATHRKTGCEVAVKEINKKRMAFADGDQPAEADTEAKAKAKAKAERDAERQKREVEILLSVRHPHVVRCYDVFETDAKLWFVMGVAKGGELFNFLKQLKVIPEAVVRRVAHQSVAALQYLHTLGIVHRDIKLENMLLAAPLPPAAELTPEAAASPEFLEKIHVQVSDFGLSRMLRTDRSLMTTMCGTPVYVAPEVVNVAARENVKGYTPAVDYFSLGVAVYALLTGRPPFPFAKNGLGQRCRDRVEYANNVGWPEKCTATAAARNFVGGLLKLQPQRRLTAEAALGHDWLAHELEAAQPISLGSGRKRDRE